MNFFVLSDLNECAAEGLNSCDDPRRALCTNTIGSYECQCSDGYSGDGETCTGMEENTLSWEYTDSVKKPTSHLGGSQREREGGGDKERECFRVCVA